MDLDTLHQDILLALPSDPIATKHISADGQWCYDSMLKGLSKELTLVLSDTRELNRIPDTK